MVTRISSRAFNQDTARAKRAAADGIVVITDRGRPSHVLLSWEAYSRLTDHGSIVDLLGEPDGVADIELRLERDPEPARAAALD